jgi:hypothetical protein
MLEQLVVVAFTAVIFAGVGRWVYAYKWKNVFSPRARVVKIPSRSHLDSAMSGVQFDRLLDDVRTAIKPASHGLAQPNAPLRATNDNHLAWPLFPFSEGWYAAH